MYRFRKAFLIASGLVSSPALAVDTTWQGPGADFNTGANWSVGVPGSTDTGIFAGASPTTVLVAAPNTVDALRFDTNGYALQFSGSGSLTAHTINGSSDFLLGSSTLTVGNNSFLDSLMSGGISGSGSLAVTGTSTRPSVIAGQTRPSNDIVLGHSTAIAVDGYTAATSGQSAMR